MKEKVLVAMSGGVDSSVAALVLKESGYDPVGVTMRLWNVPSGAARQGCCSLDDVEDAKRVASQLGIPHYTLNMKEAFKSNVVDYFVGEYRIGRTPNPCIACNRVLKFKMLVEKGAEMGIGKVATGHYARIVERDGKHFVARGVDRGKDQSYFLFDIPPANIPKILFPIGEMTKEATRNAAAAAGLKTAMKAESQEICFVPEDDYPSFLIEQGLKPIKGNIVTSDGKVLGKHKGTHLYTIGQRRGLGIGYAHRLYVTAIDTATGNVTVGPASELETSTMILSDTTLHLPIEDNDEYDIQVRYRQEPVRGRVFKMGGHRLKVEFNEKLKAVAPGQAGVLYLNDAVAGGGWIESFTHGGKN